MKWECFDNALLDASRHQTHGSSRAARQTPGLSRLSHTHLTVFRYTITAQGVGERRAVSRVLLHILRAGEHLSRCCRIGGLLVRGGGRALAGLHHYNI